MEAVEFLQEIWKDQRGVGFLAFQHSIGKGTMEYEPLTLPLTETEAAQIEFLLQDKSGHYHCYYTPATFKEGTLSPVKEAVSGSNFEWVDVDDEKSVRELVNAPPQDAAFLISTGRGLHILWRQLHSSIDTLEEANQKRITDYSGDKGTWNANRLLRIPWSLNYKYSGSPVVQILARTEPAILPTMSRVVGEEMSDAEEIGLHLLNIEVIKLKYALPEKLIHYFTSVEEPDDRSAAYYEIARLCRENGLNIHEAFTVLVAFENRWQKYVHRTGVEFSRLLKKIYLTGKIRGLLRKFSEVHDTESQIDWIISGGLTAEGMLILSGPPGVGKTQFSLRTITRAVTNPSPTTTMGTFVLHKPIKTLFVSLEMGEGEIAYFLKQMKFTEEQRKEFDEHITFFAPGESLYLNSKEGQHVFEELVAEVRPELTVIDTLGSAISGELSSEENVRSAMDYLDQTRHRFHTAFWFNHHQRKATADNKKPNKLSDLYGSTYIAARVSTVYCLYPASDDQSKLEIINLKNRFAAIQNTFPLHRTEDLNFFGEGEGIEGFTARESDKFGHGDDESGSVVGESQTDRSSPDQKGQGLITGF